MLTLIFLNQTLLCGTDCNRLSKTITMNIIPQGLVKKEESYCENCVDNLLLTVTLLFGKAYLLGKPGLVFSSLPRPTDRLHLPVLYRRHEDHQPGSTHPWLLQSAGLALGNDVQYQSGSQTVFFS